MSLIENSSLLPLDDIENIEKLTIRWIFQAVLDFGMEAYDIFLKSPDDVKDVAEDTTREILDRLQGFNVQQRIFGTVDYKKARYIILPEQIVRQALFVDSKAEKENRTATIQMSQTSMSIRQIRARTPIDEQGLLPKFIIYNNEDYLTTTAIVHFKYEDVRNVHYLREVTIAVIPNGVLQDQYNLSANDTIWLVGRNAPTLGEDFRVRLSFQRLKDKAFWRVQKIYYNSTTQTCSGRFDH